MLTRVNALFLLVLLLPLTILLSMLKGCSGTRPTFFKRFSSLSGTELHRPATDTISPLCTGIPRSAYRRGALDGEVHRVNKPHWRTLCRYLRSISLSSTYLMTPRVTGPKQRPAPRALQRRPPDQPPRGLVSAGQRLSWGLCLLVCRAMQLGGQASAPWEPAAKAFSPAA